MQHWYILGAGTIGCLWASKLLSAGIDCSIILKDQCSLKEYLKRGITIEPVASASSDTLNQSTQQHYQPQAYLAENLTQQFAPKIDVQSKQKTEQAHDDFFIEHLLITTKAQDTVTAISQLKDVLNKNTKIVLLQNGINTALHNQFPHCYHASTTDGAHQPHRFTIQPAGSGSTHIGHIHQTAAPDWFTQQHQGLWLWDKNIKQRLWKKLAINCCINPLTALNQCRNGELLTSDTQLKSIKQICIEFTKVAATQKLAFDPEQLFKEVQEVAEITADNFSSMYKDVYNNQPTEIEYLNGYLCDIAAQHGVDVTVNKKLLQQINQQHKLSSKR